MDPDAYRSYRHVIGKLPPYIPVNEEPYGQPGETSAPQGPPDTKWTMSNPNLDEMDVGQNNVTTFVGSSPEVSTAQNVTNATPWMSSTEQQPLMWSAWTDASTPQASNHSYPHPDLSLPHPSLNLDFRMSVMLNPRISVGPTPFGHRNWISFIGGSWSGSWGAGIVLPGGQDSQLIISDGSARLETNYILETYDRPPAHIVIKTHGWRTGPPEVLAQLADPELADKVDPNSYKFRLFVDMETGDERYRDKVNCGMWVGSGMRKGAEVIYDAYRVS